MTMVSTYERDPETGEEVLVYREADADELADIQARAQAAANAQKEELARAWVELRMKRDRWLAQTDPFFVSPLPSDFPAAKADAIAANADAWRAFRQALRDLPASTSDPRAATWPAPPASPAVHLT